MDPLKQLEPTQTVTPPTEPQEPGLVTNAQALVNFKPLPANAQQSFVDMGTRIVEGAKSHVSNATPPQRVWNELTNGGVWDKYFKPDPSLGRTPEGFWKNVVVKSAQDAVKIGADVISDIPGSVVQMGKSIVTGKAPKAVDIYPGASAMAEINPEWRAGYDAWDKTKVGRIANDVYGTALAGTALLTAKQQLVGTNSTISSGPLAGKTLVSGAVTAPLTTPAAIQKAALAGAGAYTAWRMNTNAKAATAASERSAKATEDYTDITRQQLELMKANQGKQTTNTTGTTPEVGTSTTSTKDSAMQDLMDWGRMNRLLNSYEVTLRELRDSGTGGAPPPVVVPIVPELDPPKPEPVADKEDPVFVTKEDDTKTRLVGGLIPGAKVKSKPKQKKKKNMHVTSGAKKDNSPGSRKERLNRAKLSAAPGSPSQNTGGSKNDYRRTL